MSSDGDAKVVVTADAGITAKKKRGRPPKNKVTDDGGDVGRGISDNKKKARLQYEWLVRQTLRWRRPDGSLIFEDGNDLAVAGDSLLQAALAIGGILLNTTGFDVALGGAQSADTLLMMRIFDIAVPLIGSAIAIYLIAVYPITEQKAHEVRAALEQRRGAVN